MFISDFAIRRPIVTITAMLALVAFGVAALLNLQTDEFPDVQQPVVALTIPYPGASPETVEREIIDPLEEAFSSISGVDWSKTEAHATDGLATFVIFFDFEKDLQQASQDVRDAISTKRADLPTEMEEPILSRLDPGVLPVLSIALTSNTVSASTLTRLVDPDILRELRSVPGVAEADLIGGVQRELSVYLRPADLQAAGVSVSQVVQALGQQNLAAPVGRVTGPLDEFSIRLRGRLDTPEEFQKLVVGQRNGELIRLGQVATVVDGTEEQRDAAFYNSKQAVGIDVKKAKGYSTTQVTNLLEQRIAQIEKTLPAGIQFEVVQNAGTRVSAAVRNVQEALVEGALLTVLVVFLFLNSWRSTVITGLALPVSVLASFIAVWAFGFTLNTMSLLGLSLAIGILIDDAIVVRENIVRHIEMGEDHYAASQSGTDEIGLAVAATTFSIVAVFVPVAFMYGVAGQWFKPFALTIACAVLVSLFVSFSLDPMLSAYWADPQVEEHQHRNPVSRALEKFNHWFDRTADRYKGLVAWALDHRGAMVAIAAGSFIAAVIIPWKGMLTAAAVIIGVVALAWILTRRWPRLSRTLSGLGVVAATMAAIVILPKMGVLGAGFVPVSDRSEIDVIVQAPPGANLDYTVQKTLEMARIARDHPEVAYTYSTIGTAIPMHSPSVDQSLIYIRLVPKSERSLNQEALGRILRNEMRRVSGADVSVFTSGFGGAYKQIQMQLQGPDATVLTSLAERLAAVVRQVPGAVDVGLSTRGQKPELEVTVDRGLAGTLGVTVGEIAQSLRAAFAGID
ncbi:MAG TPA: efflux RND transporter permease subunit, partial [Gemmatimonadales bacterium]|nr:efflux RND transporter permease subunit [Gemmatimonadales bacterium]